MPMEKTKAKTLNKLIDNGFDTEKKITAMDLKVMLEIPSITVPEIQIITELQSAIKSRSVIAYLSEGRDEEKPAYAEEKSEDETQETKLNEAYEIDNVPEAFVNMSDNVEFPNNRFF